MFKRRKATKSKESEESRRLADESAANLQRLRDIAKKLNQTAERMALTTARLQGEK